MPPVLQGGNTHKYHVNNSVASCVKRCVGSSYTLCRSVTLSCANIVGWKCLSRGGVPGPAGPAKAGPLFSGLLVSFPDLAPPNRTSWICTHVLLNTRAYTTCNWYNTVHSAACSSCASQSSPTRRPVVDPTPPLPPLPPCTCTSDLLFAVA